MAELLNALNASESFLAETYIIYNKSISRSEIDTDKTFKKRVASIFNTTPRWVYVPENPKDTIVLSKEMEKYDTYPKYKEFLKTLDKQHFQIEGNELLIYWFDQQRLKSTLPIHFLKAQFLGEGEVSETFVENLFDRDRIKERDKKWSQEIEFNKRESRDFVHSYQTLNKLPYTAYRPFQKKETFVTLTLKNIEINTIEMLFSLVTCSLNIPVVLCSTSGIIYKQYDGVELPERWKSNDYYGAFIDVNTIVAMVCNKPNTSIDNHINLEDYVMCGISIDEKSLKIVYLYNNNITVQPKTFVQRIISSVKNELNILNILNIQDIQDIQDIERLEIHEEEINIKGNYIIPCKSFDTVIISDMIMNDPIFSSFMVVDESRHASKTKGGLSSRFFVKDEEINCTLTSSVRDQRTEDYKYVRSIPLYVLPEKGNFIRLYVKHASCLSILPVMIKLFSKLVSYYVANQESIYNLYHDYGCKVKIAETQCNIPKITSIEQTEVYTRKYSRHCEKDRLPTVKEFQGEMRNDNTMTFPSSDSKLIQNVPSHTYTCETNNGYPYIGLQANTQMDNRDTYPYVPCCFIAPQSEKATGLRNYLEGVHPSKIEKTKQQNIRIKKPFIGINEDEMGTLPENLTRLLRSVEKEPIKDRFKYLRQGVYDTPYSLLECVMTSTNDKKPTRVEVIDAYRQLTQLPPYQFTIASQENPGESVDDIYNSFSTTTYLDPRKWCHLLESVFKCKIVTFSRKGEEDDASITFPNHQLTYLQYDHPNPNQQTIVCVYEHYGVDITRSYPLCELIVYVEGNTKFRHLFGGDTSVVEYQQNSLRNYYYSNFDINRIPRMVIPFKNDHIQAQFIDSYGKMRAMKINNGDIQFIVLTTPLPPLAKPIIDENELYRVNHNINLTSFIERYVSLNVQSCFIGKDSVEITFSSAFTLYTIKVDKTVHALKNLKEIPKDEKERYPTTPDRILFMDSNQKLARYFTERRLANIIVEYFIYFYSSLLSRELVTDENSFKKYITIDKNVVYDIPTTPEISLEGLEKCRFLRENNFIVSNEETINRLFYGLRHRLVTQYDLVRTYYQRNEMYHFYSDNYHYASVSGQQKHTIVTTDLNSVETIDNVIHDRVETKSKFFIKHPDLAHHRVCLLVQEETKEDAQSVSNEWQKNKRVIDIEDIENDEKDDTVYVYNSKQDVTMLATNPEKATTGVVIYQKEEQQYLAICAL